MRDYSEERRLIERANNRYRKPFGREKCWRHGSFGDGDDACKCAPPPEAHQVLQLADALDRLVSETDTAERERDEYRADNSELYARLYYTERDLGEARKALAHLVWLAEDFERKLTDSDLDAARAALASLPDTDSEPDTCDECAKSNVAPCPHVPAGKDSRP